MDLEEKELPGVVYRVVEQMAVDELIGSEDKPTVMRALLLKHRHVHESDSRFRFNMRRNTSSYSSLQVIFFFYFFNFKYELFVLLYKLLHTSFFSVCKLCM